MSEKIIIIGSNSGLGKYLHENLDSIGLNRNNAEEMLEKVRQEGTDIIIHCAFNSSKHVDSNTLYDYYSDNVLLTQQLVDIPHKMFIFISSVDIYPKTGELFSEKAETDVNALNSIYSITKLISESIIKRNCRNYLILRCTALLGKDSRKNSLIKILKDKEPEISVSPKSTFNYILHEDILDFIRIAIEKNIQGIYNMASSGNVKISNIANTYNKKVKFGNFIYDVGNINNKKASSLLPSLNKTSEETISKFIEMIK